MISLFRVLAGNAIALETANLPQPPDGFDWAANGRGLDPLHPEDKDLVSRAQHSTFTGTQLPSGYRVPHDGDYRAYNGILVKS